MKTGNQVATAAAHSLGRLDRLPEDVVLLIFSKIMDFKVICQCLLVSKRFASIIYRIRRLTVRLSGVDLYQMYYRTTPSIRITLREILCSTKEEIPTITRRSPMKSLKFWRSLKKFKDLKAIHVEFNSPKITCCYSPLNMKLICSRRGSIVETLSVILPSSTCKHGERVEESQETKCQDAHQIYFAEWLAVLFLLIKTTGDSLESVTMGDSNRAHDDVFVLRDKQLVEWRKMLLFPNKVTPKRLRTDHWTGNLMLPTSGYVMKMPLYMIMNLKEDSDDATTLEYDGVMTLKYNNEKELLRETVTELKKHVLTNSPNSDNESLEHIEWTVMGRHRQTSDGWTIAGRVW